MPDDLHTRPPLPFEPRRSSSRVPLIHPDMLQPRELFRNTLQYRGHRRPILDSGAVHHGPQDQPLGVPRKGRLRPLSFFAPSSPRIPPTPVVLTDWRSRIPALGCGARPALMRTASRRA